MTSKLEIGRYLTGELEPADAERVAEAIEADPELKAHVDRVKQAEKAVLPFDAAALRNRAHPSPMPAGAANDNRAFLAVIPLLLAAAIALFFVIPSEPTTTPSTSLRGASVLAVYHLDAGGLEAYDDRALGDGDVVAFKVDPGHADQVVVLSIDGRGTLTVHYPGEGDEGMDVRQGLQALPGSVILDDAPGPEIFVAAFDQTVQQASDAARRAYQAGGIDGVRDLAASEKVDVAVVNRR